MSETAPGIYPTVPPHGFTQYVDYEGDVLTFGLVEDDTERTVHGFVAAISAKGNDGFGLSVGHAIDLLMRLWSAVDNVDSIAATQALGLMARRCPAACTCYPGGCSPDTFEGPQPWCDVHGQPSVAWAQGMKRGHDDCDYLSRVEGGAS